MNPAKKHDALTKGLLVKSKRMTGMTLIGEMATTNARGRISPTTTFTQCSSQICAGEPSVKEEIEG